MKKEDSEKKQNDKIPLNSCIWVQYFGLYFYIIIL